MKVVESSLFVAKAGVLMVSHDRNPALWNISKQFYFADLRIKKV